jgi:hypothetical protein
MAGNTKYTPLMLVQPQWLARLEWHLSVVAARPAIVAGFATAATRGATEYIRV